MDPDEPQKLIPNTDGKQMAGHSYSTRSKAKRTSHSETDNDNSGPQSDQPPLKRKSKTQQASKSAKIMEANPADECTPAEIALRNELVLESLFRFMNRSDLLSCRVVNEQWQYEATKELRRRELVIRISFQSQGNRSRRKIAFQDICTSLSKCKTPSLLSSFEVSTDAFNDLGSAGVRSIFSTIGNQLKNLTLDLYYWSKESTCESSSLMTDLQRLLCRQTPSLEFLKVRFDLSDQWNHELQALNSSAHRQNDNNKFLLTNLKTFIVLGPPPLKFFADVINAAPNLRSVGGVWSAFTELYVAAGTRQVTYSGGFWSACIKYFMRPEGRNKIHLLKNLRFQLVVNSRVSWSNSDFELMETFLREYKQNLKLETFECVSFLNHKDDFFPPRIVCLINQILECSSGSLLKLRIEPAKWFKDLLIIPRLPQLQEIWFEGECSSSIGLGDGGFFPRGFNMNYIFPNVSSIALLECDVSLLSQFVSRMEIEMTEPVPSVRRIILIDTRKDSSSSSPLASDFHHIFPNLLSVNLVDREKYYEI